VSWRPRLRAVLASPQALLVFVMIVGVAWGLITTPPEYEGVRNDAVFAHIVGMFSAQVFHFIGQLFAGTAVVALFSALLATLLFRGFGILGWRRRALYLFGGWYWFLLAACVRAPSLFQASLMRIPLFDRRLVFLISRVHFLAYPIYWGGLYLLPALLFVASLVALVRLGRWWLFLMPLPLLFGWQVAAPHLQTWRDLRAVRHERAEKRPKSVLVIALDSLRADQIGRAIDGREVAPELDQLRDRSLYFPETIVAIPRTAPSLVSFFRSQYPIKTGVTSMFPAPDVWDQSRLSLPTLLKQSGYYTFAVSDYVGEFMSKVSLGFSDVEVPTVELPEIIEQAALLHQPVLMALLTHPVLRVLDPPRFEEVILGYTQYSDPYYTVRRLVAAVRRADAAKQPFFGFLFLSAPHFPYASLFPHYSRYAETGYSGAFHFQKDWVDEVKSDADKRQIRALYAGGVEMSDGIVGEVVRLLMPRLAGIVITGDHGELLYDKPDVQMGHGDVLRYSYSYTVPLMFFDPAQRWPSGTRPGYVRSIDFAPTIYQLLTQYDGLKWTPPNGPTAVWVTPAFWDGLSLLEDHRAERAARPFDFDSMAYVETEIWMTADATNGSPRVPYPGITELLEPSTEHHNRLVLKPALTPLVNYAKYRMFRAGDYKLVYKPTQDAPIYELYDLAADPDEQVNLAVTRPALAAPFEAAMKRFLLGYSDGFLDE
jgi:arylsulfatase A-like enzyme